MIQNVFKIEFWIQVPANIGPLMDLILAIYSESIWGLWWKLMTQNVFRIQFWIQLPPVPQLWTTKTSKRQKLQKARENPRNPRFSLLIKDNYEVVWNVPYLKATAAKPFSTLSTAPKIKQDSWKIEAILMIVAKWAVNKIGIVIQKE